MIMGWGIRSLKQVAPNELTDSQRNSFTAALEGYVLKRWTTPRANVNRGSPGWY